jgi:hypothetical protein
MKYLLILLVVVIAVTAWVGPAAASHCSTAVPLPSDLQVTTPPTDGIDQELACYSGKWCGIWDGNVLDHVLVVEEMDQAEAKVIYAYGTAANWNIHQPGWFRVKGQFIKGALVLETRRATITYKMHKDGTLRVTYEGKNTSAYSTANLKKAEQ